MKPKRQGLNESYSSRVKKSSFRRGNCVKGGRKGRMVEVSVDDAVIGLIDIGKRSGCRLKDEILEACEEYRFHYIGRVSL